MLKRREVIPLSPRRTRACLAEQCSGILEKEHNAQQKSACQAEKEANMKSEVHSGETCSAASGRNSIGFRVPAMQKLTKSRALPPLFGMAEEVFLLTARQLNKPYWQNTLARPSRSLASTPSPDHLYKQTTQPFKDITIAPPKSPKPNRPPLTQYPHSPQVLQIPTIYAPSPSLGITTNIPSPTQLQRTPNDITCPPAVAQPA